MRNCNEEQPWLASTRESSHAAKTYHSQKKKNNNNNINQFFRKRNVLGQERGKRWMVSVVWEVRGSM